MASVVVKVRVKKWDQYNPRQDVKRPSWFRVDHQMIDDADFFALTHGEFRAWIYVLSQCCRKNSASVVMNLDHAERVCNIERQAVLSCLKKLCDSGHVEADVTDAYADVTNTNANVTSTGTTRRDSTLRDETRRDGTGRKDLSAKVAGAPITAATWFAYADAWNRRHGGTPLRDKQANAQLKKFVERVGQEEAPKIAAYYVTHNDAFYLKNRHPVNLLLAQCERIRADWLAGGMITHSEATQTEKKQGALNVFGELLAEAEAKHGNS